MKNLPRFLRERYKGYEILDLKEWILDGRVEIHLSPKDSKTMCCHRCKSVLEASNSKHKLVLEDKPTSTLTSSPLITACETYLRKSPETVNIAGIY